MSNDHQLYKNSLKNWKDTTVDFRGSVPVNWTDKDLDDLEWVETFCIDELPQDDLWQTSATEFKLWQEDLYRAWGHIKPATQHYMSFEPKLSFDLTDILKKIDSNNVSFTLNFMKIPSGRLIPWHCDTYGYAINKFNVPADRITDIRRTIVFMQDWSFGQVVQFGDSMLSHWKAGDLYTWQHEAWHGLANFGSKDVTIMQITNYD
jgi:hypothetical protein